MFRNFDLLINQYVVKKMFYELFKAKMSAELFVSNCIVIERLSFIQFRRK